MTEICTSGNIKSRIGFVFYAKVWTDSHLMIRFPKFLFSSWMINLGMWCPCMGRSNIFSFLGSGSWVQVGVGSGLGKISPWSANTTWSSSNPLYQSSSLSNTLIWDANIPVGISFSINMVPNGLMSSGSMRPGKITNTLPGCKSVISLAWRDLQMSASDFCSLYSGRYQIRFDTSWDQPTCQLT